MKSLSQPFKQEELEIMSTEIIKVPDLGGADEVEVIEVCVAVGDSNSMKKTLLVVLESDKASMEVPSPTWQVKLLPCLIKEGDSHKRR